MIEARVVADSISPDGVRIITVEGTLHRFVLGEAAKHRALSISAQSSRAVPVKKMIEMVQQNCAVPVYWGANQAGMTAKEECNDQVIMKEWGYGTANTYNRELAWLDSADYACHVASAFNEAGYHKQIVNRILEPYLWQRVLITATEWANFFALRLHKDAQPELRAFAECVHKSIEESNPTLVESNDWHLPFVDKELYMTRQLGGDGLPIEIMRYYVNGSEVDLETAKRYSAARCATTSYRTDTINLGKGLEIYQKLIETEPYHSVPLEHVCRPLHIPHSASFGFDDLVTHVDREGWCWSGNSKGWGQMRKETTGAVLTQ